MYVFIVPNLALKVVITVPYLQDVNFVTKFLIRNFFKDNNAVARAPYVIAPLSLYCQYISRGTLRDMRETLAASVPHLWSAGERAPASKREKKLILLYHNPHHWQLKFEESRMDSRRKQDEGHHRRRRRKGGRLASTFAAVGDGGRLLFHALAARYHTAQSDWEVRQVHGNESFAQTVRSFRAARFFIATHGPAMSNILFLVCMYVCVCVGLHLLRVRVILYIHPNIILHCTVYRGKVLR